MSNNYYNNLTLKPNGLFKNKKWGIKEVETIYENINQPIKELMKLTGLSDSTIYRIIRTIRNGGLNKYLNLKEPTQETIENRLNDTVNIKEININIYNNLSEEGVSVEPHKTVNSMKLRAWSKKIKKRGQYTCAKCGKKDKLHNQAHHIFPKSKYPELAYNEGNGIVLCQHCHDSYHKLYRGRENPYNFIWWLNE